MIIRRRRQPKKFDTLRRRIVVLKRGDVKKKFS